MNRTLLLLYVAILATTTSSCTKQSELDSDIISSLITEIPVSFTAYTSSAAATSKGDPVNSNSEFQEVASFDVASMVSGCTVSYPDKSDGTTNYYTDYICTPEDGTAIQYFGLSTVKYENDAWTNIQKMYWPNESKMVHFTAYSPTEIIEDNSYSFTCSYKDGEPEYAYSFKYTIDETVEDQIDLMYAMTTRGYASHSDIMNHNGTPIISVGTGDGTIDDSEYPVNLHFKHALTQIAFEGITDASAGIEVYVKSITICNVYNSGTFKATAVTDDEDTSENPADSGTVGDTNESGDLVNADNFGSWTVNYEGTWALENVDGTADNLTGSYTAEEGGGGYSAMHNYTAPMASLSKTSPMNENSIQLNSDSVTPLTLNDNSNVMMLMPQKLTAWAPSTSTTLNYVGSYYGGNYPDGLLSDGNYANPSMNDASRTLTYLAINCEIYHTGIETAEAKIHSGYIFVPFETKDINYPNANVDNPEEELVDAWLPGYKITYKLVFGGGYTVVNEDSNKIPEPGCIPDTNTYTLRPITYTATCDAWVDIASENIDLDNSTITE